MSVSYSAVVLDDRSRWRLIQKFKDYIPKDWEVIADHMTINLGEINPEYEDYLGFTVRLEINSIAADEKVMALGVSGFFSENENPHITLAVNKKEGGTPKLSRELKKWQKLKRPILVTGRVSEVGLNDILR